MSEKDIMEKTLEAYNDVFADIVNGLLFKGSPIISPDTLSDAQPVSFYKADGKVHEQERDVSKYWQDFKIRIAVMGLENQTEVDRDMPLRVIGYDGASYREQLSGKDRYPVITLVLYFGEKHWNKRSLFDVIKVPEEFKPYVNDYRINVFEIAFLSDAEIEHFHSDFKIVADYFAHRRVDKDYRPKNPRKFDHQNEILKLLSVISRDPRFIDIIDREGGPTDMCEVLDRVEQKGVARGISIGELQRAKADALRIRRMLNIKDPATVAQLVSVEAELVERWFAEEK